MKRIWFTQQKPFEYMPLRMGCGYIQARAIYNWEGNGINYVPKNYTTRTHQLSGEYYVVEGSRFKATPVKPRIEFRANVVASFCIDDVEVYGISRLKNALPDKDGFSYPESDLGYAGATFEQLGDELLRLNPRATIDTLFYVNKLEPIGGTCERCGAVTDRLYPCYHVHCHDETPHKYDEQYCGKKIMVCLDCDWEITNGRGEPDEDAGEIWQVRKEQAYIDDPVNNPPPRWMR